MTPVYVPYWVFRAKTHSPSGPPIQATRRPVLAVTGFPLSGEHREEYTGLLIGASGALTAGETASIHPFDLSQGLAA